MDNNEASLYIEPAIEIRKERIHPEERMGKSGGKPSPASYLDESSSKEEYYFEPITLDEIVQAENDYILVGESGIGKTSFLNWTGIEVSERRIESEFIPLVIHLKDIAEIKTTADFLSILNTQHHNLFEDYDLGGRRLLFLLDGLDQVPEYGNIVARLNSKDIFGRENRIILTTRPIGYEWLKERFKHEYLRILPFDEKRIKEYIGEDYENTQFKIILDQNKELLSIPILLKMVKTLLLEGKLSTINNRADLYQEFIRYLFEKWEKDKKGTLLASTSAISIQKDLAVLSYQAMVDKHIGSFPLMRGLEYLDEDKINRVILWSVTHNLIEKDGKDVIAYTHQSFQEYFAACWLSSQTDAVQEEQILTMLKNFAHWQEVIRFFFERLDNTTPLHNKIKASLQQCRDKSHHQPQLFLACGDALGLMDEPQIDVANPPMVYFPGGKFDMGSNEYDDEKPIHQVTLSPYWLGKYPVTNKEFGKFIKADGYKDKKYWLDEKTRFSFNGTEFLKKLEEKTPRYWLDERFGKSRPLAPVVGISWYEAMAYCRWWTITYGKEKVIMRLPTEAEWEFAARGSEGREYPWGDTPELNPERVNYNESDLRQTSTVGSYPHGATPKGVLDMAGNVWEWCYDRYGSYKGSILSYKGSLLGYKGSLLEENSTGLVQDGSCVLRGASWRNDYPRSFRGGYRYDDDPEDRDLIYGLRACRTVTI